MIQDRYEQTSVCEVTTDYEGQKWLIRLADVTDNKLMKFYFNEDLPWYFDNRNRLYLKNGPDATGTIGVWHWAATPRDTDPSKDFIYSDYDPDISPVEIITRNDIDSIDALIQSLKSGVAVSNTGIDTLYCIKISGSEYAGVLCKEAYFKENGGIKVLRTELNSIPLFRFTKADTITTEGGHTFLRSLFPPHSEENVFLKSPMEVIKNIILKRCSWSATKSAGLSKNEFKHLKDYVKEIPDSDLYEEISKSCECTTEEAREFVAQFLQEITKYLNQEDTEFLITEMVVESHEVLSDKYRDLVKEEWKKQNAKKIKEEEQKLESITGQVEKQQHILNGINSEIQSKQEERQDIQQKIEDDKKFAEDVKTLINKKIDAARENAAEFVAEMAFNSPSIPRSVNRKKNEISDYTHSESSPIDLVTGIELDKENVERVDNLRETVGILTDDLQEAGVSEEFCSFVAAFFIGAWNEHMPLLMAGPNTDSIADTLSASLNCRTADHVKCRGNYSQIPSFDTEVSKRVVVIENVFSGNWIDHICDLTPDNKSYYIFTNPFAEDLLIEPHGLYNYMLPFFTELFISDVPTGDFYGGILSEKFTVPRSNVSSKTFEQYLREIGCGKYLSNRMSRILRFVASCPGYKQDWNYYMLLPYSFLTGTAESLAEKLDNDTQISNDCKNLIRNFLGAYK